MTLTIPRPDDWHVHLRQGEAMPGYARAFLPGFGRILAMPNTVPPLVRPEEILEYRRQAMEAAPGLEVLGTFRLMPGMGEADIQALAAAEILAGKYYPDGATINSAGGVRDWRQIQEALAAMEKTGMVLCIHGEDPAASVLDREEAFLPAFMEIRLAFPRLKMILEHVSSAAGVKAVLDASDIGPTAATITVQHMYYTLDDLLGGMLNPHLFCKPVVKFDSDRTAITERILADDKRFFFGSDSAPHLKGAKESDCCPAGAYTAPLALQAVVQWFDERDALEMTEPFLCRFGREFYGVDANTGTVTLERKPWTVPNEAEGCVPLMAGIELEWSIVE